MTRTAFLEALTACAGQYTWSVAPATGFLRGTRAAQSAEVFCPLTAVAYAIGKGAWSLGRWEEAAYRLTLPLPTARTIIGAADGTVGTHARRTPALRQTLLEAVGLREGGEAL